MENKRKDDKQINDLKIAVNNLTTEVKNLSGKIDNQATTFAAHEKKTAPMYEWFQNINFTKRAVMWILGFISAIGGLILLFKEILK